MAKTSGGTRGVSLKKLALERRKAEFDNYMKDGRYDREKSYFDNKSGGYVVVEKTRRNVSDKQKEENQEDIAAVILANKGFKIRLVNDSSNEAGVKRADGYINGARMDIKTINSAGGNTIKTRIEKGASQGAKIVILVQNTKEMTPAYVESQIKLFREKSPYNCRKQVTKVIVIYEDGKIRQYRMKMPK